MAGSNLGTLFHIATWGESHGKGVGVVVDGCPAGLPLTEEDIQIYLNRRKPGQSRFTTPRKEDDQVEILSGVFEGKTTGTPISLIVYNKTQRSADYSEIASYYRPGHADFSFDAKYGFRDYRGGGRSSGRETIASVAAGAIACKLLKTLSIDVTAYTQAIGGIEIDSQQMDLEEMYHNAFYMPDANAAKQTEELVQKTMADHDSLGGVVECIVTGLPAGIGEPVFDKLDASLAKAMFSIGAVKGFEIGDGMKASVMTGSQHNDGFTSKNGAILPSSNHAGGILGGISDGASVLSRTYFKPTPSILKEQHTVTKSGEDITVSIKGRHDPLVVPRAVVVVECMTALTVLDLLMQNITSTVDGIQRFYQP